MDKEELKDFIQRYLWRITHTSDCFQLFWHLNKMKSEYLDEMNKAPAFFQLTDYSLHHTALVELQKFYDEKGASSLYKLLNICEQNSKIFLKCRYDTYINASTDEVMEHKEIPVNVIEDIANSREKIKAVEGISTNLKGQRDKYYAHLDGKYRDNEELLSLDFPLSYNDVMKLLEVASEVCNTMLSDLCAEVFSCHSTNVFDVDNILKFMKKHK